MNLASDENADHATVDRAYVEGPLFGATVTAGRTPLFTAQGLVFDDRISGATVAFGSDEFTTTLAAGRYSEDSHEQYGGNAKDITAEYYGVQFDYAPSEQLALNAGYTALTGIDGDFSSAAKFMESEKEGSSKYLTADAYGDSNKASVWYVGGSYAFDKNVKFVGEYAQNTEAEKFDDAWTAELQYKGANPADAGSWGMYAGYRDIGNYVGIAPTYDDIIGAGYKGFVAGVSYAPAENILASVQYFDGKDTVADEYGFNSDASKFFANVDFFF